MNLKCLEGRTTARIVYDIRLDEREPKPGDFIYTQTKRTPGSVYLIIGVRKVRSRVAERRFEITAQRGYSVEDLYGVVIWPLYWYPRKKRGPPTARTRRTSLRRR